MASSKVQVLLVSGTKPQTKVSMAAQSSCNLIHRAFPSLAITRTTIRAGTKKQFGLVDATRPFQPAPGAKQPEKTMPSVYLVAKLHQYFGCEN
jgi:hypothetical protein